VPDQFKAGDQTNDEKLATITEFLQNENGEQKHYF